MIGLKITESTKKLQDRLQCLQYLATHRGGRAYQYGQRTFADTAGGP